MMSSQMEKRTVTNTESVLINNTKNPPKMEMKLAEEQTEMLETKLDYVKAEEKEKETAANTGSTNGLENEPKNPPKMEKELTKQPNDILKAKVDYVKAKRGNLPALHFAAYMTDVEVCRHLVEQEGADINELSSKYGATALHYAAMNGHRGEDVIDYFLEKGCDLEKTDSNENKPVFCALKAGNFELAIKLFHLSQDRRNLESRTSLLCFSLEMNNLEFAKYVSKFDEILCKDPDYDLQVILTACKYGNLAICKWLHEKVKIHRTWFWGDTLKNKILCHAASNRYYARDILQYLFSRFKSSTDEKRNAYGNALVAVFQRNTFNPVRAEEFLQLLRCNVRFKISGFTLMHYAVTSSLAAVQFVYGKDISLIDEVSDDGATVLHLAAMLGNVDICMWLINHGQDIYAVNKNNFGTFLHYAAQNVSYGAVIIKKFGPKVLKFVNRVDEYSYTPLHYALVNKNNATEIARTLITFCADLSVKREGNNFLHFCIAQGNLECAKLIHAKNSNLIKKKGEGGKTTLHIAADNFNEEICAWLVKEGCDPRELTVGEKSVLESTCSADAKKFFQSVITTKK
ncbi:poly [ADP-ribose] polymerase tankyrase-2-like [Cloeon dipterum]|uniref:poly [ADP-ribose] polymerase tankyrase-2-like n=1 Tax=Cloeon dipterum TaxID=197152 RepID=UPI0032207F54